MSWVSKWCNSWNLLFFCVCTTLVSLIELRRNLLKIAFFRASLPRCELICMENYRLENLHFEQEANGVAERWSVDVELKDFYHQNFFFSLAQLHSVPLGKNCHCWDITVDRVREHWDPTDIDCLSLLSSRSWQQQQFNALECHDEGFCQLFNSDRFVLLV